ncbi:MAG TPA: hypothetical protein VHZ03_37695 [Trebonia sp.]|nr:hypothetical protein [Trebonia sp.]
MNFRADSAAVREGGTMGRTSRRQRRRYINLVVMVAILVFGLGAYASFRRGAVAAGVEALGSTLIILGICFMFTWPTKCRIVTSKESPCKNESYGMLLGCRHHTMDKLRIRLGMLSAGALKNTRPADGPDVALPNMWAKDSVVSFTIDSGAGDTSAFVFGLVSAVTGVASVIVGVLALR